MSEDVGTTGDYENLTVAELKEELKGRGLRTSGRKAELVERLIADINRTIENIEDVIEQTEEAAEAVESATEELGDVSDAIADKDLKGALTELKDASDEIQEAAEETIEAADSALVAAEDISGKASRVISRWNALSKNQKIITGVLVVASLAFVAYSNGYFG